MSFIENIRSQSKDDARRFARGIYCKIVHQPDALNIIKKYKLAPGGIQFNTPTEFPYFNSTLGKFFAIPSSSYITYLELIRNLSTLNKAKDTTSIEYRDAASQKELNLVEFMKQNLVLITIPAIRLNGELYQPDIYDVIIETVDLNQTMDCIFVRNNGQFALAEKKI